MYKTESLLCRVNQLYFKTFLKINKKKISKNEYINLLKTHAIAFTNCLVPWVNICLLTEEHYPRVHAQGCFYIHQPIFHIYSPFTNTISIYKMLTTCKALRYTFSMTLILNYLKFQSSIDISLS